MNQAAIEKAAGIDHSVAKYMMESGTVQAKTAMDLLRLCVAHPDRPTLALLQAAVLDCVRAM